MSIAHWVNHGACIYVCSGPVLSHPCRLILEVSLLVVVDIVNGNPLERGLSLYSVVYPSHVLHIYIPSAHPLGVSSSLEWLCCSYTLTEDQAPEDGSISLPHTIIN